jgi:hypothetical protein
MVSIHGGDAVGLWDLTPDGAKKRKSFKLPGRFSACAVAGSGKDAPVDLLKLIDLDKNVVWGQWRRDGSTLITANEMFSRVQIPYDMPAEYDVTIVAAPLKNGANLDALLVGLPIGGGKPQIAGLTAGWDGTWNLLDGLDGKMAAQNETSQRFRSVTPGVATTVTYQVRRTGISVAINGKTVINWKGDFNRFNLYKDWVVPDRTKLFIGTHRAYEIRSLVLRAKAEAAGSAGFAVAAQAHGDGILLGKDLVQRAVLPHAVETYAFSPNGSMLATACLNRAKNGDEYGSTVMLWKVSGAKPAEFDVIQQKRTIKAVAFSPDGTLLATGSLDNIVRIWELDRDSKVKDVKVQFPLPTWPRYVQFTPDGSRLICFTAGADIVYWNLATRKEIQSWKIPAPPRSMGALFSAWGVAPDGRHLAIAQHTGRTLVLRLPNPDRAVASEKGAAP